MLGYLLVILDSSADSFCYYNTNKKLAENKYLPFNILEKAIVFALKNDLSINFILGKNKLPSKYEKLIESINHIKIVPIESKYDTENCIYILNYSEINKINQYNKDNEKNFILRVEKKYLKDLSKIIKSFKGKYKRLNLTLLDIDSFTENDFVIYKNELKIISKTIIETYKNNKEIQINTITDRLVLKEMNNCDAGIKHLTLAPNGCLYLCPAFYYEDEFNSIGNLMNGYEIKNKHLLKLSHAPICRICDAYHCKRCIYLNKKTTLELNTPSMQQCVVSHMERNASKGISDIIIKKSKKINIKILEEIPELNYLDPFEIVKDNPNLYV